MCAIAAVAMVGPPLIAVLRWSTERFRIPLDEADWLRVATLPWFRSGKWPNGLQARLVAWLQVTNVEFADTVAKAAVALFIDGEPPLGSAAHLRWELDLMAARTRGGDQVGELAAIQKMGATALQREAVGRISGTPLSRAPRWIHLLAVAGVVLWMVAGARFLIASSHSEPTGNLISGLDLANVGVPFDARSVGVCPAGMVYVPAGMFRMGGSKDVGELNANLQHAVALSGYCIDKTEVTVAAFKDCVAAQKCTATGVQVAMKNGCNYADQSDHPINCVDWDQAATYCRWAGKRLPTEAEWEYAARGSDGRMYPWGNEMPSGRLLNACGDECSMGSGMYAASDGWKETAPVGSFPDGASPFGVLDMAGNVWEWTSDWYGGYPAAGVVNPKGAERGTTRVLRGGGWHSVVTSWVSAASRSWYGPSVHDSYVGFRCARGLNLP
jgi:formylglycine-generating enzyme required for sulfatase activity